MESHSVEASNSTPEAEPLAATPTAPDDTRVVVLLISDGRIVRKMAGSVPLNIADADDWQPNKEAVQARYKWLSHMMGGPDTLIKLALDIMRL